MYHCCALQAWQQTCANGLRPDQPFELHQQLFAAIYSSWSEERFGPPPVWVPDVQQVQETNIARFMKHFHVSGSWHAVRRSSCCCLEAPGIDDLSMRHMY